MNLRPAINVLNARIYYIISTLIVWAVAIALWAMFGFAYFIATLITAQIVFYVAIYALYHINVIDVILQWRYCGKHAAVTYVISRIMNS